MSTSKLPPPPPPPSPTGHMPWTPPPKRGLAGFWGRRSSTSKVAIVTVGILAAAVIGAPSSSPVPTQTPRPTSPAAVVEGVPTREASPRPTLSATPMPIVAPSPSIIVPSSPASSLSPAPTLSPKPTPRLIVVSDVVLVDASRTAFRGAGGTYTWSDVSIDPNEVRVAWDASAATAACKVRWEVAGDGDDPIAKTVKVAPGGRSKGARIIDTSSISGAIVTVNSTCPSWLITMKKAPEPTPKPQARRSNCHPSYTGECLRPGASDYDCAGGSGNGPYYVYGTVRVVGPDVFDLDRDNDGLGCE